MGVAEVEPDLPRLDGVGKQSRYFEKDKKRAAELESVAVRSLETPDAFDCGCSDHHCFLLRWHDSCPVVGFNATADGFPHACVVTAMLRFVEWYVSRC